MWNSSVLEVSTVCVTVRNDHPSRARVRSQRVSPRTESKSSPTEVYCSQPTIG